jgi:hypothetical protein
MFGFDFFNHTFTSIFFSNFLQGKQRLLYSLLDAMQSVSSQAVVLGISCRLVCALQLFPYFPVVMTYENYQVWMFLHG